MLFLDHESITKGGVHFTPNPLYTLSGILTTLALSVIHEF